jgi:hypothetical protein
MCSGLVRSRRPHEAEIAERDLRRRAIVHQRDDRLRQQHLSAVRDAHDARGAV